jgi:hypothetical protein
MNSLVVSRDGECMHSLEECGEIKGLLVVLVMVSSWRGVSVEREPPVCRYEPDRGSRRP